MPRFLRSDRSRRVGLLASTFIVACGLLAGCGGDDDDSPIATAPPEPTKTVVVMPTALSGTPSIGSAVWTSAVETGTNAPLSLAPTATDTTIYAVFPIESLPTGSQLVASWFFNNTSLDALGSAMRIDRDRVDGWIEFHIERTGDEPWPDGEYEIVVSDGTTELQRAMVTIS